MQATFPVVSAMEEPSGDTEFYGVELFKQLGLEPDQHYKPPLNGKNVWDSKIKNLERKLSNIEANLKRKEIVLPNLDSLLEHEDLDVAAYSHKRHTYLVGNCGP